MANEPTMDLLSLVLKLRPIEPAPAPVSLGRAAHALMLGCLAEADPALAEELHDGSGPRPFTVSSLLGPRREGLLPEHSYRLRLTGLHARIVEALMQAAESGALTPGEQVQLGPVQLVVEGAMQAGDNPWSRQTTYSVLSAPWMLAKENPKRRIRLRLTSPTTFRSGGKHQPLPLPGLVFGSLLTRWNAFAPIELPEEVRRYAEECLAVSRFDIASRSVPLKEGGLRKGAVGWVEYYALNPDRYWLSMINLLADFSLFSGVGAGTTMGLGQVRREALHENGRKAKASTSTDGKASEEINPA